MMLDLDRQDWSTKRLRERAEAEESVERQQKAREARRRAEQRQVESAHEDWWGAIDERFAALADQREEVLCESVGQALGETRQMLRDEFAAEIRELKTMITALEKRLDERQSLARRDFKFARGRGEDVEDVLPDFLPPRTVQKIH